MRLASRRTKWRTTSFQKHGLLIGSNALESLANGSGLRLGFRSSVYRTGMNDWSDEEIFDPIITDDLNLYKVEKWTKDRSKVDGLFDAGNERGPETTDHEVPCRSCGAPLPGHEESSSSVFMLRNVARTRRW